MAQETPPQAISVVVPVSAIAEEAAAALEKVARPRLITRFIRLARDIIDRDRQRRELLTIIAEDHRTAVDLAKDPNELREWASKSPWRV